MRSEKDRVDRFTAELELVGRAEPEPPLPESDRLIEIAVAAVVGNPGVPQTPGEQAAYDRIQEEARHISRDDEIQIPSEWPDPLPS